jgi:hypothetical protein
VVECLEERFLPSTFTVLNTNDSGPGSLRQAILDADSNPGRDTIRFNISGPGVQTIAPQTALPDITDSLLLDGWSQPGFSSSPLIELSGNGLETGLNVLAASTTIRGLDIHGFLTQIDLNGPGAANDRVQGCYIGTDSTGLAAGSGPQSIAGIQVLQATGALIGTDGDGRQDQLEGNVIGGNGTGVVLFGASNTRVSGNLIGLGADGRTPVSNNAGIVAVPFAGTEEGHNNLIGARGDGVADVAERNVISGNLILGIELNGESGTQVAGNFIGTDATGETAVGNGQGGIQVDTVGNDATGTVVIGVRGSESNPAGARNVIAGNSVGVDVNAPFVSISGNYIGTDATGEAALGNGTGVAIAVSLGGSLVPSHSVVGVVPGRIGPAGRNVISGNGTGVKVVGSGDTLIAGNYIGTDARGSSALPNTGDGIDLQGGTDNVVGGLAPALRNVISGNQGNGVTIEAQLGPQGQIQNLAVRTRIEGNYIGLTAAGDAALGNGGDGVSVQDGAIDTVVGAAESFGRNVIAASRHAVFITGPDTARTQVAGNYLGTNAAGTAGLANFTTGVSVFGPVGSGTVIGGTVPGAGNLISGNVDGIFLGNTSGVMVAGNRIGTDAAGKAAVPNLDAGVEVFQGQGNVIGTDGDGYGDRAVRNVISGNNVGVRIEQGSGNAIAGNWIGTDVTGRAALGNQLGVELLMTSANRVGVDAAVAEDSRQANVIAGNIVTGVHLSGTSGDVIAGNVIGLDAAGNPLGNGGPGVLIDASSQDVIGGVELRAANRIADNAGPGIEATESVPGDSFLGNALFANGGPGIQLSSGGPAVPTLSAMGRTSHDQLLVNGSLSGAAQTTYRLEFFAGPAPDASGNAQAQERIGVVYVTTDAQGQADFQAAVQAVSGFSAVTATVTDNQGNTSPLAAALTQLTQVTPLAPTILMVTSAADSGTGSLRDAIQTADGGAGPSIIQFNITGSGVHTIILQSSLPDVTAPVLIDGASQPGYAGLPLIQLAGDGTFTGLRIVGPQVTVRGLDFTNFVTALEISGPSAVADQVQSSFFGTDPTGTMLANNSTSILIDAGASEAVIGTDGQGRNPAAEGNLIEGGAAAVNVTDASFNRIAGNRIGTDITGEQLIDPTNFSVNAVEFQGSGVGNVLGTNSDGRGDRAERNILDGLVAISSSRNVVAGNFFGTDATGQTFLTGAQLDLLGSGNRVGGLVPSARNVFVGQDQLILVTDHAAANRIQGNTFGLAADGKTLLGSATIGINLRFCSDTLVGASEPAGRNVLAGNGVGILVDGGTDQTHIAGNYIGTDITGQVALGNGIGIQLLHIQLPGTSPHDVLIGGPVHGAGNVISGNGIGVSLVGVTNVTVAGNIIGLAADGTTLLPNTQAGVQVIDDVNFGVTSTHVVIGTNADGIGDITERNIISGNGTGIAVTGGQDIAIAGNFIGTDRNGRQARGNGVGIVLNNTQSARVGRTELTTFNTPANNVIAGNTQGGLSITGGQDIGVAGNSIGVTQYGAPLGNGGFGVDLENATRVRVGGLFPGAGNRIVFNDGPGVHLAGTDNCPLLSNAIFGNSESAIDEAAGTIPFQAMAPVLTASTGADGLVTVTGTLDGEPRLNQVYRVEIYASAAAGAGGTGQGEVLVATLLVLVDGSGHGSFSLKLLPTRGKPFLAATVTDFTGNTSQFSLAVSP